MPTYDYLCRKCGKTEEVFQSITAKPLTKCPRQGCGGKFERQMGSGSGFIFKGSGFYITDYRSEGYKQAAKKESETAKPATAGDSKSSSKAESKPAKAAPAPKSA